MKQGKNKENNAGRPTKYRKEYNEQAYELCLLGLTDKQLAEHFEVNVDTIHEWKKAHPEFSDSLNRGKLLADGKVAAALYKRAIGFSYEELTFEKIDNKVTLEATTTGEIKTNDAYKKKIVTKMVVPDAGAAALWLKNRQRELWRDNEFDFSKLTDEQIDSLFERLRAKANQSNQ